MKTEIHRFPSIMGLFNCYLIKQDGVIMVDASIPRQGKKFLKWLKDLSVNPRDISLILLTHGHLDHIGSASEFKKLTDCEVAINYREKNCVETAHIQVPPGINCWGKMMSATGKLLAPLIFKLLYFKFPGTAVDLTLNDEEYKLQRYGINGRIIYTPGHTYGSMSLLLDTGAAFVGDLAVNGLPLRIGPGMCPTGERKNLVNSSWRLLLSNGAKRIYPAHGKPFSADALEKLLQ